MSALPLATIPVSDLSLWAQLTDEARRDTQSRLDAMVAIGAAKRLERGAVQAAWAARLGVAYKSMQNLWSAYSVALRQQGAGAWKTLLDTRRFAWPEQGSAIPAAAQREFRVLIRKAPSVKEAHAALLRRWRRWLRGDVTAALPGYASCPPDAGQGYPAGLSLRNFQSFAKKAVPAWERTAVQRGLSHVRANLPQVLTSRTHTYAGAQFQFDDMWHNVQVLSGNQVVRVLQLGVVDVHTGCLFDYALKARERREDGTANDLNEAEMRAFTANVLLTTGYDAERGTTLMVENAKATLREDTARLLHDFTGGKIRVDLAPMQGGRPLAEGWWKGKGGGNPQFKPIIERLHGILQNKSWELAGQVGRSPELAPEWLQGMYAEEKILLKAIAGGLRPERAALLRHPFLGIDDFAALVRDIYALLNGREDHRMEGWRELGYIQRDFRALDRGEDWISSDELLALGEGERAAINARVLANAPQHTRERRLSPQAVWQRQRGGLRPISEELACLLVARDFADLDKTGLRAERTNQGAYFVVQERGARSFFETRVRTSDGTLRELTQGEKYQVMPFGTRAFIRDLDGRYLGSAPLWEPVNPLDRHAIHAATGAKGTRAAGQLAQIRADHAAEAGKIQADHRHNARVIDGAAVTPAEKQAQRRAAKRRQAVTADDRAALSEQPRQGNHGGHAGSKEARPSRGTTGSQADALSMLS